MTPEQLTTYTDPVTKKLVHDVVDILDRLKHLDIDLIDRLLTINELAKPVCPPVMVKAMKAMEIDLKLVKIFSEQAKKYDQMDNALASYEEWIGKEEENE